MKAGLSSMVRTNILAKKVWFLAEKQQQNNKKHQKQKHALLISNLTLYWPLMQGAVINIQT
jgi:hypothetical protein